jgi:hypothetical protein
MKNINKLFIFLTTMFIFLTISSCSPQKRLQNLLRKNPELLIVKKDTTIEIKKDTLIRKKEILEHVELFKKDTTYIVKNDRIKTKVTVKNDSIHITTIVNADTTITENTIKTINTENSYIVEKKKTFTDFRLLIYTFIFLLVVFFFKMLYDLIRNNR